jgi:hypothetical protein
MDSNVEVGIILDGKEVADLISWFDSQWNSTSASDLGSTDIQSLKLTANNFKAEYNHFRLRCAKATLKNHSASKATGRRNQKLTTFSAIQIVNTGTPRKEKTLCEVMAKLATRWPGKSLNILVI